MSVEDDACALRTSGVDVCWAGFTPLTNPPLGPCHATCPIKFQQISAGNGFACGIEGDGAAYCWGDDSSGVVPAPRESFTSVAAGQNTFACGLRPSGSVACWGDNAFATSAPYGEKFADVAAAGDIVCGLTRSGAAQCWWNGGYYQNEPAGPFTELSLAQSLNNDVACALKPGGAAVCWDPARPQDGPPITPTGTFSQISVGGDLVCGVHIGGTAECWGDISVPAPSGTFSEVSAGARFACGVETSGDAACWGDNTAGESSPPTGKFATIAAGENWFACGIRLSGAVTCWGNNGDGEATPPAGDFLQISAGADFASGGNDGRSSACGLRSDYAIVCWGDQPTEQRSGFPLTVKYVGPTGLSRGQAAKLTAQLHAQGGAVVGRQVTITVGSGSQAQSCKSTRSDLKGRATCKIKDVTVHSGPAPLVVSFEGDDLYASASRMTTVPVH